MMFIMLVTHSELRQYSGKLGQSVRPSVFPYDISAMTEASVPKFGTHDLGITV